MFTGTFAKFGPLSLEAEPEEVEHAPRVEELRQHALNVATVPDVELAARRVDSSPAAAAGVQVLDEGRGGTDRLKEGT